MFDTIIRYIALVGICISFTRALILFVKEVRRVWQESRQEIKREKEAEAAAKAAGITLPEEDEDDEEEDDPLFKLSFYRLLIWGVLLQTSTQYFAEEWDAVVGFFSKSAS